ncbi:hypothetical protein ACU686_07650 [Yinghuangia aomiensis]
MAIGVLRAVADTASTRPRGRRVADFGVSSATERSSRRALERPGHLPAADVAAEGALACWPHRPALTAFCSTIDRDPRREGEPADHRRRSSRARAALTGARLDAGAVDPPCAGRP